jgi:Icc-related predicted phosphoesterase
LPRIFFATDVHGSDICWKKFIAASEFYQARLLVLGGDMTGKALIPIIAEKDRTHTADFQDNHLVLKSEEETAKLEKKISDKGYYRICVERSYYNDLHTDADRLAAWGNETFNKLMAERVNMWMNYADSKLKHSDTQCFVCPGNDDMFDIDSLIQESTKVTNAEGKILEVGGDYEMLSTGWSTPTPWKTYRECSEEELGKKIEIMTNQLKNPVKSIFNFHDPPAKSGLDDAPALTKDLDVKAGGRITNAVGSVAVRQAIEKVQPMLGLHGHIHESKGIAKIGRTICINPGSVYEEGTLMGAIADLKGGKVERYFVTAG